MGTETQRMAPTVGLNSPSMSFRRQQLNQIEKSLG
jgi:hypothetical protein